MDGAEGVVKNGRGEIGAGNNGGVGKGMYPFKKIFKILCT